MVLVTVKITNKTGGTWDAGDSVCELPFGPEGACPDRRETRCIFAAYWAVGQRGDRNPLLARLTITAFIVLITQLSAWCC
jgi:hypothetical protein